MRIVVGVVTLGLAHANNLRKPTWFGDRTPAWQLSRPEMLALADGPTEVHMVTLARQVLKGYEPYDGLFRPYHLPARAAAARARFAELLEHEVAQY